MVAVKEYPCSVRMNEGWRAECNLRKLLLCEAHCYQNLRGPSSFHEVLVTPLLPVIEIRPQSEGKGIQAHILVSITRLKPRALDLTWRKTKPTTPLGVGYPSDP